jgi:hypothetical protein
MKVKGVQEKVSWTRHSVKIEKSVTSAEPRSRKKQFTLGDRFFHLHLTLMQDTYNVDCLSGFCFSESTSFLEPDGPLQSTSDRNFSSNASGMLDYSTNLASELTTWKQPAYLCRLIRIWTIYESEDRIWTVHFLVRYYLLLYTQELFYHSASLMGKIDRTSQIRNSVSNNVLFFRFFLCSFPCSMRWQNCFV